MTCVYYVRHGQNPANISNEFSCLNVDYPLTELGREQAQMTANYLSLLPVDAILASPMLRCQETAAIIATAFDLPVITVEAFREILVGDFEGQKPNAKLWAKYHEVIRRWHAGEPDAAFPAGESYTDLWTRWQVGMKETAQAGKTVIVVGHGGQLAECLHAFCPDQDDLPAPQKPIDNCAVTTFDVSQTPNGPRATLISYADARHIRGDATEIIPD